MFQGGFGASTCAVSIPENDSRSVIASFYPEDKNNLQEFAVEFDSDVFRIEFNKSTDFYGRIIIYRLIVKGDLL